VINTDDLTRVRILVNAVGGEWGRERVLTIPGTPWSKDRPRFAVRGSGKRQFVQTYSTKGDVTAEARTAGFLRRFFPDVMTGNVAMVAIFHRHDRQSIDADNLLKHVCDSANGVVWRDDSQATAVVGVVEYDPVDPRTVLAFAPHRSSMLRGSDAFALCRNCNSVIDLDRLFCGSPCAGAGRRKGFVPYSERSLA
jgi:Holliday junction resolvase RusA-like endonuclease